MIRKYLKNDYHNVIALMGKYGLNPMTEEEIRSGVGFSAFVSRSNRELIGFIWAIVSKKVAVIDILVVNEDYRYKTTWGRSDVGLRLASAMFKDMYRRGVTRYIGLVSDNKVNHTMLEFYTNILKMRQRKVLSIVSGNPFETMQILEARHGRRNNHHNDNAARANP